MQGDEVIGLPSAFLGSGAAAVIVSPWLVQDERTATLMMHWYRQSCEQMGRAAAQQALRERFPHSYYWAPLVLVGQC